MSHQVTQRRPETSVRIIERIYERMSPQAWLVTIVLFGAVVRLAMASHLWGTDDLNYADLARIEASTLFGAPPEEFVHNHHSLRKGLVFPVALLYSLFGVSDWTTGAFPFVCSLGLIVLAHRFGRLFVSEQVGLLAAGLMACFPLSIIFASVLWPTEPQALFVSWAMYLFFKAEKQREGGETVKATQWLLIGSVLGMAYLIHITSLFVFLFFGCYLLMWRKRFTWGWGLVVAGVVAFLFAESFAYYVFHEEWWYSFKQANRSQNDGLGWGFIVNWEGTSQLIEGTALASFWLGPWSMAALNQEFALYYIVGLPALAYAAVKHQAMRPLVLWFAVVFLWTAYGTTTPARWIHLGRMPRYYAVISLPLMVAVAIFARDLWLKGRTFVAPLGIAGVAVSGLLGAGLDDGTNTWFESQFVETVKAEPQTVFATDHHTYSVSLYYDGFSTMLPQMRVLTQHPDKAFIYKDAHMQVFTGDDPLKGVDAFLFRPESWDYSIRQPENCGSKDKTGKLDEACVQQVEKLLDEVRTWGEPEIIASRPRRWLCAPMELVGLSLGGRLESLCAPRRAYIYRRPR
ncbi:MAG: ArnT family glycosyltransferase [Bradymonadia bacterium]